MRIVCMLPSVFSERSNGVITLCSIYECLQRCSPISVFFVCKDGHDPTLMRYRELFGDNLLIYSPCNMGHQFSEIIDDQFILVRPDDLEGIDNPMHWDLARAASADLIINILLAPPFVFANKVPIANYYGIKDCFLLANQALMPAFAGLESHDLFIEQSLPSQIHDFVNTGQRCSHDQVSVYLGKGIANTIPGFREAFSKSGYFDFGKTVFIKRSWPSRKEDLYSALASSRLLISFDPFSHIERVSTYLGTPVLKMARYNLCELPGVLHIGRSLAATMDEIPGRVSVHQQSAENYLQFFSRSPHNASKITSLVLDSFRNRLDSLPLSKGLIPYSKRCLYAFASQLRVALPQLGAIAMAAKNEMLETNVLLQLLDPDCDDRDLTPAAINYKRDLKKYQARTPSKPYDKERPPIYFQYIRKTPNAIVHSGE